MKIGVLLISDCWGGTENFFFNILNSFTKLDNEIILIVNNEISNFYLPSKRLNIFNIGDFFNKGKYNIFHLIKYRRKILDILRNNDIDILQVCLASSIVLSYNISKRLKLNQITRLAGGETATYSKAKKSFYEKIVTYFIERSLLDSEKIISPSNWQINQLCKEYKEKSIVIPNGIDLYNFKSLNKIKQKKNVILFAGRFIDIKGIAEVVNVAKQLPQYEFWFAGKGPLADLINLPNTKNLGFKSTKELIKLYNQANICIFPSYRESFGLVGLEAMSCGKAVIATPLGFSEYIENGKDGIIIPAKDEVALKNAIVDLMTNEKKRKMLEKNARKKALQYSWDNVAKQYMKVFKEVINKS